MGVLKPSLTHSFVYSEIADAVSDKTKISRISQIVGGDSDRKVFVKL